MRSLRLTLSLLVAASSLAVAPLETLADGPTLLKRSVRITAHRFSSYWRDKKADSPEWNTWSWVPKIYFEIVGPVEGGTQFLVDYTTPDGKPWLTERLPTDEVGPGQWDAVETELRRDTENEQQAILTTGTFGFTIRTSNELTGSSAVLMKGSFKVGKLHVGIASRPNEQEYYVDQDWRLPLGTAWLNSADNQESPPLYMGMWVRGAKWRRGELAGYLFHNGRQIASTKTDTWSHIGLNFEMLTMGNRDEDPAWRHLGLDFQGVRGTRGDDNAGRTDLFFLDENPGDYELKILHDGKLVRSMKFSVGTDGRIVDSGIGTEPRPSGTRYLIPVTIAGDMDGTWNKTAWKTEAYYGNPYAGFSAQQ